MKKTTLLIILIFNSLLGFGGYNFKKYYPIYKDAKPLLLEDLEFAEASTIKTYRSFFGAIKGLSQYLTVSDENDKEELKRVLKCVKIYETHFAKIPLYKAKKFIHAFESVFCTHCNYERHVLAESAVWSHAPEVNAMRVFLKTMAKHFLELNIDKTMASPEWMKYIQSQRKHFSHRCMRINLSYKSDVSLGEDYDNMRGDDLFLAENKKNN